MPLSDADWRRFDKAIDELKTEIKDSGSKVHKLETRVQRIEDGSPHKCEEIVKLHEDSSIAHNPRKVIPIIGGLITVIEGFRKFFHA